LVEAVIKNKKMEAISHAMSTLIAVSHALDASFNSGKGRIFEVWKEGLLGESPVATSSFSKPEKRLMSDRFEAFLSTMKRKDS